MCDSLTMKPRFWLSLLGGLLLAIPASAADWTIQRLEGREYISLESIAAFYGFPKPPAVELTNHPATPAPTAPAPKTAETKIVEVKADEPSPIGGAEPPPAVAASKTITLDSGNSQLEVTVGLREVQINGVKQWLAFPVLLHEGQAWVSRL